MISKVLPEPGQYVLEHEDYARPVTIVVSRNAAGTIFWKAFGERKKEPFKRKMFLDDGDRFQEAIYEELSL